MHLDDPMAHKERLNSSIHLSAAHCIKQNANQMILEWEKRVLEVIPAARQEKHFSLTDSIFMFLEELYRSLEENYPKLASSQDIAESHAAQRLSLPKWNLDQVLTEYNLLRRIIFDTLDHNQIHLSPHHRNIIFDFIQRGKHAAAVHYCKLVTNREKEITNALRQSEKRFRALFELAATGKVISDAQTKKILKANLTFCKMTGFTEAELKQKTISELIYPEDLRSEPDFYNQLISIGAESGYVEKRYLRKDGSNFWGSVSTNCLPACEGEPEAILATIIEITDKKKAEEEHQRLLQLEYEARLQAENVSSILEATFAAAPIGFALLDPDLRYLKVNEVLAKLNGVSPEEHIGKKIFDIVPELAPKVAPKIEEARETQRVISNIEVSGPLLQDQSTHYFLTSYYPVHKDGKIWAIGAMVVDITERKRLEVEREAAVNRLKDLQQITESALSRTTSLDDLLSEALNYISRTLQSDIAAIFLLDPTGKFLELKAAKGLDEIQPRFLIPTGSGIAGTVILTGKPQRIDDIHQNQSVHPYLISKKVHSLIAVPLRTKSQIVGVIHAGRLRSIPFTEDNLNLLQMIADRLAAAIDNSQLYSRLQTNIEDLQHERELREQFVNSLTHDLRNPLAAALASAQLILRYPERTHRVPVLASRISDAIIRADRMIQDLLDTSRIRAGQTLIINPEEQNLVSIVKNVSDDMNLIHGNRIQVISSKEEVTGYWDSQQLRRAIENLVNNAIKYGDDRAPVWIGLPEPEAEDIQVYVKNQGKPIPPEEQEKLFENFRRGSQTRGKQGWGIGLTLVQGVAEAHGGCVEVRSTEEEGTVFTIHLPRDRSARSNMQKQGHARS